MILISSFEGHYGNSGVSSGDNSSCASDSASTEVVMLVMEEWW